MKNDFAENKDELFGLYGSEDLMNDFTSVNGIVHEGGVKSFKIVDIRTDEANQTITTYLKLEDALEQNANQWIKWRKIPGEAWKIKALSFNGLINQLS